MTEKREIEIERDSHNYISFHFYFDDSDNDEKAFDSIPESPFACFDFPGTLDHAIQNAEKFVADLKAMREYAESNTEKVYIQMSID